MTTSNDEAPLLSAEGDEDHPQAVGNTYGSVRVVLIDSARYCDARNGNDVLVVGSYGGTLAARLVAPHKPVGVISHDVGIAADGSGISGLPYFEALGIPAATVEGATAELGNARDMLDHGVISRANVLAERCGVTPGMSTAAAARLLATVDPGSRDASTKVRRQVITTDEEGRSIVVTDSIVFALPEDSVNVLVTAGHTGSTGARFIEQVSPWGFICADGGTAKNGSGTAGLVRLDEVGLAGACYDVMTAAIGDAFDAWSRGLISTVNDCAHARGVRVGQRVDEAAALLLAAVVPQGSS
ncbi:unannotated protein [freshwater metagenome]|uniref:Unannotated protein n=1 Tax=freshwater metagenome TaxID=449393 RepID=A0A6J7ISR2_9ZZZZ|nr:hypothetical protein [Actinomycetota bacterium]